MGITTDLKARLDSLFKDGPQRIVHPEFLHLEQVDGLSEGHRRLQLIRSQWGHGVDSSQKQGKIGPDLN